MADDATAVTAQVLRISDEVTLPLEAVTETFAILAKRGSGKTYTAAVLVEELADAGLPVVVVDPVGVWWGLRADASGRGAGLPFAVVGGDHADLPLVETAGKAIAEAIVEERLSVVLDLSLLSKSASRRFMVDFLETLYLRNRDPLFVVLDEADLFAPQRAAAEGARLLGAVEDLVRRGRARGLGVGLITQRPAVLHKDVLSQAEVLVALRMTGPRDVAAIDEWVRLHADDEEAKTVKASLPSLPVGTAWIWSPGWLGILTRTRIRTRRTFDSSATPKPGQIRPQPHQLAAVDIAALGARITNEDSPGAAPRRGEGRDAPSRAAEQRIRELEARLTELEAHPPTCPHPHLPQGLGEAVNAAATALDRVRSLLAAPGARPADPEPVTSGQPSRRRPATQPSPAAVRAAPAVDAPPIKAGARRILSTLANHHPLQLTKAQLGTLAKLKISGGTFSTYWGVLRRAGYVEEHNGLITITDAGIAASGVTKPTPMTPDEIVEEWRSSLKAGARTMLDIVMATWPETISRDDLAEAAGIAVTGGTFSTYLGTLRRNGLVTVEGNQVRLSPTFYLSSEA